MRGIGVAVITSMSVAPPLSPSASRWCTPKRCCSSITASARSLKRHRPLEQRMRADERCRCCRPPGPARIASRSRPFSRPVRIASRMPGGVAQRLQRREMLACQDFGRRHQRGLSAVLDDCGHGQQRDDRLARTDIALQQAQHAFGLARYRR